MLVTRKAEYAVSALVDLALYGNGGRRVPSRDIARRQGIPENLVVQLLGPMRRAGWVEASRGRRGGVTLIRDPASITVRDVLEMFEGPLGVTRCLVSEGVCENQPHCPLRGVWARAQARLLEVLEGTTIADLARARRSMDESAGRSQDGAFEAAPACRRVRGRGE
ncbi:MAG: Rrf2 family transcriptional regulator [Bacillota bacterium]